MKNLMNSVTLMGNVGMNPEVKITNNGRKMATLSLATGERRKGPDGKFTRSANWHKLVVWGKKADLIEHHVGKGQRLFVEGRLVNRRWTDNTGKFRQQVRVEVQKLFFINRNQEKEEITQELPF